jgi:hypothetical protein
MNTEGTIQVRAASWTMRERRAELATYLAQQPKSKQVFHKWMQVLEMAGLALIAGAFAVAMYVSINPLPAVGIYVWTAVPPAAIATAWLAFPVSTVPLMILIGAHTIILRADSPIILPGKSQRFVTGSKAVWAGVGQVVIALAVGAFWGTFAWAVWAGDMGLVATFIRILGTALGVLIPIAMVASMVQKLFRFR